MLILDELSPDPESSTASHCHSPCILGTGTDVPRGLLPLFPVDLPVPRHQLGDRVWPAVPRHANTRPCRVEAALCVHLSSCSQRVINENNIAFGQGPASRSNHGGLLCATGSPCRICCSQIPTEGRQSPSRCKAATCAAPQGSSGCCLGLGRGEDPGWQPPAGCLHLVRAGDPMPSLTKQSPGMLLATPGQAPSSYSTPGRSRCSSTAPSSTVLKHQVSI